MESFTLLVIVAFVRREGLTHVGIPLVLLIDEMIGSRDVIVSVSFKASDRILLFELKVAYEATQEIFGVRHLLESREKAWLLLLR